jgi:hypothetical protein
MKKFMGLNKRNGRVALLSEVEGGEKYLVEYEGGMTNEVKIETVKRWWTLEEIDFEKYDRVKIEDGKFVKVEKKVEVEEVVIEKKSRKGRKPGERADKWSQKLTEEQVREIKTRYWKGGERNKSKLAREYAVSSNTIFCIIKEKMWKHVTI